MDVSALCQVASWSGAVLLWYCTSHKVDRIMKTNDYIQIFQLHPNQQLKLNWGEASGPWSPTQFKTSFGKKQANITLLKWPWPQSYQILVRLLCTDIIACSLSQMTHVCPCQTFSVVRSSNTEYQMTEYIFFNILNAVSAIFSCVLCCCN